MKIILIGLTMLLVGVGGAHLYFTYMVSGDRLDVELPSLTEEQIMNAVEPRDDDMEVSDADVGEVETGVAAVGLTESETAVTLEEESAVLERRDLSLQHLETTMVPIVGISRSNAERACAIIAGGLCIWGSEYIAEDQPLDFLLQANELELAIVTGESVLVPGETYTVEVSGSDSAPEDIHLFLIHKDLLGRINGRHEAGVNFLNKDGTNHTFAWDLQEVYLTDAGTEEYGDLREGTYEILAFDSKTGAIGILPYEFRIGINTYESNTTEYGANTPLADSRWSGKGIFLDAKEGIDTAGFVGDMNMYDIFKGVDFPERGHVNTIIFLQAGQVVITAVNTEIFTFDDRTVTVDQLKAELAANGGALYMTKEFNID